MKLRQYVLLDPGELDKIERHHRPILELNPFAERFFSQLKRSISFYALVRKEPNKSGGVSVGVFLQSQDKNETRRSV